MRSFRYLSAFLPVLLAPATVHAADMTSLPEPGSLALLGAGVLGVIVGRRLSSKRRQD